MDSDSGVEQVSKHVIALGDIYVLSAMICHAITSDPSGLGRTITSSSDSSVFLLILAGQVRENAGLHSLSLENHFERIPLEATLTIWNHLHLATLTAPFSLYCRMNRLESKFMISIYCTQLLKMDPAGVAHLFSC